MLRQKKKKRKKMPERKEQTLQLEEINQEVLAKEVRLKTYRDIIKQYEQNKTLQNNESKFFKERRKVRRHIYN